MSELANYFKNAKISSKIIHEGYIINVRRDDIIWPDGKKTNFDVIEHNGGVVVLAMPTPEEVILIRQYRYCLGQVLYELPAGKIDKNEDPFIAAKRELQEETGYQSKNWQLMTKMITAPGFCNEILHLYKASDLHFVETNPDEHEVIEVDIMSIKQAWQMILTGQIQDAKTIAGIGLVVNQM